MNEMKIHLMWPSPKVNLRISGIENKQIGRKQLVWFFFFLNARSAAKTNFFWGCH